MLTGANFRAVCVALAFVTMAKEYRKKNGVSRIMDFAGLVEQFCHLNVPGAFEEEPETAEPVGSRNAEEVFAIATRMAKIIAEILHQQGTCEPAELLNCGFSHEEIERYWPMAMGLAKVELNWMN